MEIYRCEHSDVVRLNFEQHLGQLALSQEEAIQSTALILKLSHLQQPMSPTHVAIQVQQDMVSPGFCVYGFSHMHAQCFITKLNHCFCQFS